MKEKLRFMVEGDWSEYMTVDQAIAYLKPRLGDTIWAVESCIKFEDEGELETYMEKFK